VIDKAPRRTPRQRAIFRRRAQQVRLRRSQRWGAKFRQAAIDRRRVREVTQLYRETGSWSTAAARSILMMMRRA